MLALANVLSESVALSFLMRSSTRQVCVPICERNFEALAEASARASVFADLIEFRLDCLDPMVLQNSLIRLSDVRKQINCPAIVTFRPQEQGGRRQLDFDSRLRFWLSHAWPSSDFVDMELDLIQRFFTLENSKSVDWSRVICSFHDFDCVPGQLDFIYEQMRATPARVLKIAVWANDVTDCIPVFKLFSQAREENRELIAIAMGTAGMATRILGPSLGGFLTYGAAETDRATAPGQITARELKETYRLENIGPQTKVMGLLGLPVGHSISPHMQNAAFTSAEVDAVYIPFEVRDVASFIRRMVHPATRELNWNIHGLSVTAPHKSKVMEYLDSIEASGREIGAINTILLKDKKLHGYNTDCHGFVKPLLEVFGQLRGARCAIIGAGGAASAALWALQRERANATIFARDYNRACRVAQRFGADCHDLSAARFAGFDVVINATPLGTAGSLHDQTPVNREQMSGARMAYDLVYNPIVTRFLREAREAGCITLGGLPMLVAQAVEQFRLWTGRDPDERTMRQAALRQLEKSADVVSGSAGVESV